MIVACVIHCYCEHIHLLLISLYVLKNYYSAILTGYPVRIRNSEEGYTYQEFSSSESAVDVCRYYLLH